ncbi:S26 family signal peptidase [Sphingomonas sp.]|uniref:S26 family signal peptidase n=1 Tax=Sphingomonas sp. TaxID=28214 RepID=UPI0025CBA3BD|nr:S26 family signal peptidase [Sphingomonas sp.]MBV9526998.1 S26 family signal peptidase [Sphingomonas sp.]MBV9842257.1 S26 family signal peptidase [Sphingomonadaceae bacterium]
MTRRNPNPSDLPLFVWGDARLQRDVERRRLHRRVGLVAVLASAVTLSAAVPPLPRLVWNASASAPIGLYFVTPGGRPRRGDIVIARVATAVRALAASRRYIPADVPLVKHVGGLVGDTVCAVGNTIIIDGKVVAIRRRVDAIGRVLPWWRGCRLLGPSDIFLLSGGVPASFDGRYFGVSPRADIIGTARPLWTR